VKRFLAAIRFLTIVPLPGTWGTAESDLAGSVPLFPLVGLLLGGIAALAAWGIALVTPPMLSAIVVMTLLAAFSGCLHLDGLSDTADGFLSSRSRERILEIMRDSRAGAMGVIAIVTALLAKFAALASIAPADLWIAALLAPLAGRSAMVVQMAVLPYVRPEGLGRVFCQSRPWLAAIVSMLILAAVGCGVAQWRGLIAAVATLLVTLAFSAYAYRKIGGATGDTFGAACEIAELVPLWTLALQPAAAR
jgi:adenosylcobinamide-GDP ribazoletransferase